MSEDLKVLELLKPETKKKKAIPLPTKQLIAEQMAKDFEEIFLPIAEKIVKIREIETSISNIVDLFQKLTDNLALVQENLLTLKEQLADLKAKDEEQRQLEKLALEKLLNYLENVGR